MQANEWFCLLVVVVFLVFCYQLGIFDDDDGEDAGRLF